MSPRTVERQISKLTDNLILKNFVVQQNYPVIKGNDITWSGYKNLSFVLKDENYETIYNNILVEKDYNLLMLDGAIIQLKYRFEKNRLSEHVLTFYPCPNFTRYQDDPNFFEEFYYSSDQYFTDMLDGKILCAPLRFDFNDAVHTNIDHPKSHLSIGNYVDCRIPIAKPVSPFRFIDFILRNFYFSKYKEAFINDFFKCNLLCDFSISDDEKKLPHLSWS